MTAAEEPPYTLDAHQLAKKEATIRMITRTTLHPFVSIVDVGTSLAGGQTRVMANIRMGDPVTCMCTCGNSEFRVAGGGSSLRNVVQLTIFLFKFACPPFPIHHTLPLFCQRD